MAADGPEDAPAAAAPEPLIWLDLRKQHPCQVIMLALLQATFQRLKDAEVPCWVTGGTLLGLLRHGGFVPHDDDLDLECLESDVPRIEAAITSSEFLTYSLGGWWKTTRVAHVGVKGTEVSLDIFLREEGLEEMKDFPSAAELFPLCPADFHGVEVLRPAHPRPFLQRCYGPDCEDTVRVWTHSFNFLLGLGHDPDRAVYSLAEYEELVRDAGYQAPEPPHPDSEAALRALFQDGGPAAAYVESYENTRLDDIRRRNQEQALARARLLEERRRAREEASDSE